MSIWKTISGRVPHRARNCPNHCLLIIVIVPGLYAVLCVGLNFSVDWLLTSRTFIPLLHQRAYYQVVQYYLPGSDYFFTVIYIIQSYFYMSCKFVQCELAAVVIVSMVA